MALLKPIHLRFIMWMISDYEEHNKSTMTPEQWATYLFKGVNEHFDSYSEYKEAKENFKLVAEQFHSMYLKAARERDDLRYKIALIQEGANNL